MLKRYFSATQKSVKEAMKDIVKDTLAKEERELESQVGMSRCLVIRSFLLVASVVIGRDSKSRRKALRSTTSS